jgi:hypothetical protein
LKPAETVNFKPFSVLDAKIAYQWKKMNFFVDANNIFDKKYIDLGNIPQAGFWLSGVQTSDFEDSRTLGENSGKLQSFAGNSDANLFDPFQWIVGHSLLNGKTNSFPRIETNMLQIRQGDLMKPSGTTSEPFSVGLSQCKLQCIEMHDRIIEITSDSKIQIPIRIKIGKGQLNVHSISIPLVGNTIENKDQCLIARPASVWNMMIPKNIVLLTTTGQQND